MNGFVRTKISLLAQILEGHSHLIIVSDLMIMMKLSAPVVAYNIYHYSWERPIHEGKLPLPTPPLLPIKEYSNNPKKYQGKFSKYNAMSRKVQSDGKDHSLGPKSQII